MGYPRGMLLSRDQIVKHIAQGTIIIDPFDDRKLKTTSYDVTLGEWYWREKHPEGRTTVHNIYEYVLETRKDLTEYQKLNNEI